MDLTEDDHMSPELRAQFRTLQRLSMQQKHKIKTSLSSDTITKNPDLTVLEQMYGPSSGDTDDETLSDQQIDSRPRSLDSSSHHLTEDPDMRQLALSTAITAQNEIDTLVNGIRELETFMQTSSHNLDLSLFINNVQEENHVYDSSCVASVTTANDHSEKAKVPFVNE
jgi:hypothetical protein